MIQISEWNFQESKKELDEIIKRLENVLRDRPKSLSKYFVSELWSIQRQARVARHLLDDPKPVQLENP